MRHAALTGTLLALALVLGSPAAQAQTAGPEFTHLAPPGVPRVLEKLAVREGEFLALEVVAADGDSSRRLQIDAASETSASDPGALPRNAVCIGLPGNPARAVFLFRPSFRQAGLYAIKFTVRDTSDPNRQAAHAIEITVVNVNRPPEVRVLFPRGGERITMPAAAVVRGGAAMIHAWWECVDRDGDPVTARLLLMREDGTLPARTLRVVRVLSERAPARGRCSFDARSVGDGEGFRIRVEATDDGRGGPDAPPGVPLKTVADSAAPFAIDLNPPKLQVTLAKREFLFLEEIASFVQATDPPFTAADSAPSVDLVLDPGAPQERRLAPGECLRLWTLAYGDHVVRATATDAAGNSRTADAPFRILSLEDAIEGVARDMPAIAYKLHDRKDAAVFIDTAAAMLRPRFSVATPKSVCDCVLDGDLDAALLRLMQTLQKLEETPAPRAEAWQVEERLTLLVRDFLARRLEGAAAEVATDDPRLAQAQKSFREGADAAVAGGFLAAIRAFQQTQQEILALDRSGPEILRLSPASAWIGHPGAVFRYQVLDRFSAVDPAGLAIELDGRDCTHLAARDASSLVVSVFEPLTEGLHELRWSIGDRAGNRVERRDRFCVDVTPPTAAFRAPAEGAILTTNHPAVRAAFGDRPSGEVDPVEGVRLILDGREAAATVDSSRGSLEFEPASDAPLSDGPHTAVLRVRDRAGHTAATMRSFTVDTTPPVMRIESPADGVPLTDYAVAYVIYAVDPSGVTLESVKVNGVEIRERFHREGDRFLYQPRTGDPVFLRAGENVVVVRVRDGAGHVEER